jgi:hypothetical protein
MLQRREFLWAASSLGSAKAAAQTPSAAEPSQAGLMADIELMREALLALHPGLTRYNEPAAVAAQLNALRHCFSDAPDSAQRYLQLSRFLTTLRCRHSYANFFNQSRAVQQTLFDRPTRLPFYWQWMGEEMVVTHDGAAAVAPGDRITHVNGLPAAELLHSLMPYARADGGNDGKRRALLGLRPQHRLETFDIFHGLVHGAPRGGMHRLTVRNAAGSVREVQAPAWSLAQREADRQRHSPAPSSSLAPDAPAWQWQMRSDGVARLTMDGWAIYNSPWNWQAWLNERLDELAADTAARGLVVDIRQNEGGLDCGNLILARCLKQANVLPQRRLVRFRSVPAALKPHLDTWDPSFFTLGENATVFDERFLELPAANTVVEPSGQHIAQPVVVLTSATNSSATYAFAQRCKQSGAARLVGETTGGNLRGINGGSFFFMRLPASGLSFDLPLIGHFPLTPQPDAGVAPDVAVAATAADIAAGRDPVLDRAMSMILTT